MSKLLTKDDLLHEHLSLLIRGFGKAAVMSALENIEHSRSNNKRVKSRRAPESFEPEAAKLVQSMMPLARGELILQFAEEFDRGQLLSKTSDIRRFLIEHRVQPGELKNRNQVFRTILPLLRRMPEKALLRAISRARLTGPAQLDDISDAIKDAGSDFRQSQ